MTAQPATVSITRDGDASLLVAEQWVPRPAEEVFAFFADPHNLGRITPEFLDFRILSVDTPALREGTHIRYRLSLHGLPVFWKTRLGEWRPPHAFRDDQIEGPYRLWSHLHTFEEVNGGTMLRDRVRFRTPLDFLRRTPLLGWVDRDVERIFRYRQSVIERVFGGEAVGPGGRAQQNGSADERPAARRAP